MQKINLEEQEIKKFDDQASRWWDKNGDFKSLHKINPLEAAEKITNDLLDHESFESIHFAKPGFINFMVKKVIWYEFLLKKLDTNILFNQNIGIGEIVNIEYVSANPTGPLHIGHCRGAVFGDVLANLLESTGFNVVKEYYINDAGSQIDLLAKSVILRIEELQSNKKIDSFPAELYPGEYLIDIAQSIIKSHGEDMHQREDYFELVKSQTVHLLLEGIKSDLSLFVKASIGSITSGIFTPLLLEISASFKTSVIKISFSFNFYYY